MREDDRFSKGSPNLKFHEGISVEVMVVSEGLYCESWRFEQVSTEGGRDIITGKLVKSS